MSLHPTSIIDKVADVLQEKVSETFSQQSFEKLANFNFFESVIFYLLLLILIIYLIILVRSYREDKVDYKKVKIYLFIISKY